MRGVAARRRAGEPPLHAVQIGERRVRNDHQGTRRGAHERRRHTANDQSGEQVETLAAGDDQICAHVLRELEQPCGDLPLEHVGRDRHRRGKVECRLERREAPGQRCFVLLLHRHDRVICGAAPLPHVHEVHRRSHGEQRHGRFRRECAARTEIRGHDDVRRKRVERGADRQHWCGGVSHGPQRRLGGEQPIDRAMCAQPHQQK